MRANTTTPYATYAAYEAPAATGNAVHYAKNTLLFCAVPFIGLGFALAGPLAGLGALAWLGARAFAARWPRGALFARNLGLFIAAPFVGLAYALAAPFVGIGAIGWLAARAVLKRRAA